MHSIKIECYINEMKFGKIKYSRFVGRLGTTANHHTDNGVNYPMIFTGPP